MKNTKPISLPALFCAVFAAFALAACDSAPGNKDGAAAADNYEPDGEIVAVVNGKKLPAARIPLYARTPPELITEEERAGIIDDMITREIVAQAAVKAGLDERPEVLEEFAVTRQFVLGGAYAANFAEAQETDEAEVQKLYEDFLSRISQSKEYDVAHILVDSKEKADELLAQIRADNSAFAALATEHSLDPGSGRNGGSLGWMSPQTLVPEFSQAMQQLDNGELSAAPVQSQFGWHIIRVDGTRQQDAPPLTDELREQLAQQAAAEKFRKHLDELRAQAEVEVL